jgi:GNAT superfamily N-acetyltransferase
MLTVHEIDTTRRRDVNRFIQFPFDLYQGCPQWVPMLVEDSRMQLNRKKNPFYKYNDAAFFIAEKDGRDVGRIAVLNPKFFNEFKGTQNIHFYLFDSIDDQEVANTLFDTAAAWGTERGLNLIRGPLGFMALDGFGMLAKGFDYRPAVGIPYNYDYYPRLTEAWGFELEERVYSGYLDVSKARNTFPEKVLRLSEKIKERYGFTIKTFKTKRELVKWATPRLADLYNRTLTHIAGDTPVTQEEAEVVAKSAMTITDPRLIKIILKDGDIVGFLFCFLNISDGLKKSRGRLFPFGLIHILRDLNNTIYIDLNGMGVLPEYQGQGGTAVMYAELYRSLQAFPRFQHADVVQISEFNSQSLNELKRFGVDMYKTHHIYRKEL